MNPKSLQNLRPGGPGRPKGKQNRATIEIKEASRQFLADPKGTAKLLEQYQRGKLHPSVLTMLFAYAYGKPVERVQLDANVTMPTIVNQLRPGAK